MNKILSTSIMFLATLTLAGCSNENDPDAPIDPSDAVELGVTAGVSLTKSAIQGGDGEAGKQNGSASTVMQNVAIRATGSDYTSAKKNDKAIYNQSSGTWTSEVTDKIMLTSSIATIYAFHPAYPLDVNGNKTATAIAVTGTLAPDGDATIPVSLFEGGEGASGSPTQKANSTITDADNSSGVTILSAPGETDYLWEGSATRPTASNGKADANIDYMVDLNMKHALSMLSFRIYKDATYKNTGKLTKIKLNNASGTVLNKGTSATMNIATGAVVVTGTSGANFTRFIGGSGVTLGTSETGAHRYSILVFPESSATAKNTVQVTFTIDNADYTVFLPAASIQWSAGKNYLYTAKLTGKALSIENVKVSKWGAETGGSITVN